MWGDRVAVQWFNAERTAWWRYPIGLLFGIAILVAWINSHRHPWPWGLVWIFFLAMNLWLTWVAYRLAHQPNSGKSDR